MPWPATHSLWPATNSLFLLLVGFLFLAFEDKTIYFVRAFAVLAALAALAAFAALGRPMLLRGLLGGLERLVLGLLVVYGLTGRLP